MGGHYNIIQARKQEHRNRMLCLTMNNTKIYMKKSTFYKITYKSTYIKNIRMVVCEEERNETDKKMWIN